MTNQFEQLANEIFNSFYSLPTAPWGATGKYEDSSLEYSIPLAGLTKKDVDVQVEGRMVLVDDKIKTRSLRLSTRDSSDLNAVKAKMKNGMLTVTIPDREDYKKSITVE